jgi:hypothetical protein
MVVNSVAKHRSFGALVIDTETNTSPIITGPHALIGSVSISEGDLSAPGAFECDVSWALPERKRFELPYFSSKTFYDTHGKFICKSHSFGSWIEYASDSISSHTLGTWQLDIAGEQSLVFEMYERQQDDFPEYVVISPPGPLCYPAFEIEYIASLKIRPE